MERVVVTLSDHREAEVFERLVAKFAEELAERSDEYMFYLTQPGGECPARVVETETPETLERFIAFVGDQISMTPA
ncbi:MAG: hypothetical protein NXI12_07230 [Alphaproteobacteria bacterium]|nr:hypothetical protein [Alphaproteobacteria bacterium]